MTDLSTVVSYAEGALGDPYVWGASGPNSYDCSGLVKAAYKAAGIDVPHLASAIGKLGTPVSLADAPIGSVVYYNEPGATDHVGILVDKANGGHMIDAPHTGANVEVDPIGNPTSIRDLTNGTASSSTSTAPAAGAGGLQVTPAGFLGLPSGDDVTRLVMKAGAGLIAGALVVVGLHGTMKG